MVEIRQNSKGDRVKDLRRGEGNGCTRDDEPDSRLPLLRLSPDSPTSVRMGRLGLTVYTFSFPPLLGPGGLQGRRGTESRPSDGDRPSVDPPLFRSASLVLGPPPPCLNLPPGRPPTPPRLCFSTVSGTSVVVETLGPRDPFLGPPEGRKMERDY